MADVKARVGEGAERPFELLPAIDLRGGRVVRLVQGDFARETVYGDDPNAVVDTFARAGAGWVHVVDLDGARAGVPVQTTTVGEIIRAADGRLRVEVGGGLRDRPSVARVLELGAARVVVGTAALADPAFVASLVTDHGPDRIAVALDVRDGAAVGHGWRAGAPGTPIVEAVSRMTDAGVETLSLPRSSAMGGSRGRTWTSSKAWPEPVADGSSPRAGSARPRTCSPRSPSAAPARSSDGRSTRAGSTWPQPSGHWAPRPTRAGRAGKRQARSRSLRLALLPSPDTRPRWATR